MCLITQIGKATWKVGELCQGIRRDYGGCGIFGLHQMRIIPTYFKVAIWSFRFHIVKPTRHVWMQLCYFQYVNNRAWMINTWNANTYEFLICQETAPTTVKNKCQFNGWHRWWKIHFEILSDCICFFQLANICFTQPT